MKKINDELAKFSDFSDKIARPLIYYFLKYAKNKQKLIIDRIDKSKDKCPHGLIEGSIGRLQLLEAIKQKPISTNRYISKNIYNIYHSIEDENITKVFNHHKKDIMARNKKKIHQILQNIIHGELNHLMSIIEHISVKPTQVLKWPILPMINAIKEQLKLVQRLVTKIKMNRASSST